MYSVVLATLLTAGSATPAFGHHGCHGCHGCYSSCYSGYACYGGYSCYGCYGGYGCHGCHRGYSSCYCSSYGCYSSCCSYSYISPCCGGYYSPCCGGVILQQSTPQVIPVNPKGEQVNPPKKEQTSRVTVNLPSDARLWVDNVECPLTSASRSFNTPALTIGQRYVYNIRAEIVRDGRTITETQRVVLTPGQESRVDFSSNGGAIATASAAR